jgi:hypothetical protein
LTAVVDIGVQYDAEQAVATIRSVIVQTSDDYQLAAAELVRHGEARKAVVAAFADAKQKAHEAHKAITKLEGTFLTKIGESELRLRRAMAEFKEAEQRALREERARLEAEARERESERQLQEAISVAATGDTAAAEEILAAPVAVPVVILEETKASGVTVRQTWDFEIVDASKIDRRFLVPDEKAIRALVRSLKSDAASVVGGIRVFSTSDVVRTGR